MPRHLGWDKKDKDYQKQRENLWEKIERVFFFFKATFDYFKNLAQVNFNIN